MFIMFCTLCYKTYFPNAPQNEASSHRLMIKLWLKPLNIIHYDCFNHFSPYILFSIMITGIILPRTETRQWDNKCRLSEATVLGAFHRLKWRIKHIFKRISENRKSVSGLLPFALMQVWPSVQNAPVSHHLCQQGWRDKGLQLCPTNPLRVEWAMYKLSVIYIIDILNEIFIIDGFVMQSAQKPIPIYPWSASVCLEQRGRVRAEQLPLMGG